MKLLFLLLISISAFGQDSSSKLSLLNSSAGFISKNALTIASFKPTQTIWISWDTCLIGYFKSSVDRNFDYNKPASWSAWANPDTIIFRIPPKKLIVGETSYTSMLLNGRWYLMMDPEPVKNKK